MFFEVVILQTIDCLTIQCLPYPHWSEDVRCNNMTHIHEQEQQLLTIHAVRVY